jgi:hypothetical protein
MVYSLAMTRKEARARVGIRDLKSKEIDELKELVDEIYTRVLGPDWRNFPAKGGKPSNSTPSSEASTTGDKTVDKD